MRVATGLHTLRVGGNVDDALETIYRLHFNYGDLSKWERGVGRRLFPFYTWTRNNLPLQMEFAARYPRRFNQLNSLKRNLEYGEEREGMVPDYFLKPFGIQLPFSIGGAVAYSVPDMPFQDLMRFDPTSEGAGRAVEQLASGLTPMLKAPCGVLGREASLCWYQIYGKVSEGADNNVEGAGVDAYFGVVGVR